MDPKRAYCSRCCFAEKLLLVEIHHSSGRRPWESCKTRAFVVTFFHPCYRRSSSFSHLLLHSIRQLSSSQTPKMPPRRTSEESDDEPRGTNTDANVSEEARRRRVRSTSSMSSSSPLLMTTGLPGCRRRCPPCSISRVSPCASEASNNQVW
jgi:hypothetical protein